MHAACVVLTTRLYMLNSRARLLSFIPAVAGEQGRSIIPPHDALLVGLLLLVLSYGGGV